MEKFVGIWMDRDHAYVMNFQDGKVKTEKVDGKLHRNRLMGGARTGSQFTRLSSPTERTSMERRKKAEKYYFGQLKDRIKEASGVYIFGPAKMKILFYKAMMNDASVKDRILGVDRADSMTEAQMRAKARSFFKPFMEESTVA